MKNGNTKRKSDNSYIQINLKVVEGVVLFIMIMIGALIAMGLVLANNNETVTEDKPAAVAAAEEEKPAENPTEETAEQTAYFPLTDKQRALIEQVVAAEARGESFEGQMAVCQCIYNACISDGLTPEEVVRKYGYTTARAKPTKSVKEAVAAVFDKGESVTSERILFFYAPDIIDSTWHEDLSFVMQIGGHRFFKEAT